MLASDGKITAKDGSALFIDSTGNLTQNSAGTVAAATLDGLTKTMTLQVQWVFQLLRLMAQLSLWRVLLTQQQVLNQVQLH